MSTIWYFNVVLNFSADLIRYATFWATSKAMQSKQMKSKPFYAEEKELYDSFFFVQENSFQIAISCSECSLNDFTLRMEMHMEMEFVYKFSHGKWTLLEGMKMDVSSSRSSIENSNVFFFWAECSMNWMQLQMLYNYKRTSF